MVGRVTGKSFTRDAGIQPDHRRGYDQEGLCEDPGSLFFLNRNLYDAIWAKGEYRSGNDCRISVLYGTAICQHLSGYSGQKKHSQ